MKVRISLAAILVQRVGPTVIPRLCWSTATSKRAKCISLTTPGSPIIRVRLGQSKPRPPRARGISCTRWACPSPPESCTRQSRSRCGFSPIVSVSTATTGPRSRPSGRSCRCRWMVPFGMNCVVLMVLVPRKRLELSRPFGHRYLKPARLPIPPPGHQAPRGDRGEAGGRACSPRRGSRQQIVRGCAPPQRPGPRDGVRAGRSVAGARGPVAESAPSEEQGWGKWHRTPSACST